MRKRILIALCIMASNPLFAQFESSYIFNPAPPLLAECDALGKKGNLFAPEAGSLFRVTNVLNADTVIATFLYFASSIESDSIDIYDTEKYFRHNLQSMDTSISNQFLTKSLPLYNKSNIESTNQPNYTLNKVKHFKLSKLVAEKNRKYFLISTAYLKNYAKPYYRTNRHNTAFIIGAQTLPFKIRVRNFDFAKQVTLGTSFGWQRRLHPVKDNFIHFLGNISISANDIDSAVTKKSLATVDKNIASFSLAAGVVFETRKIQLAVMCGWDIMSKFNQNKYNWIYNKKMWVGFGVGVNVFSSGELTKSSTSDKQ